MSTPQRLVVFVSFDYELFLGSNYLSDEEVLFRPTADILDACDRMGVKTTFFADVCSLWAHAAAGKSEYAQRFEEQLRDCVRRGHDVQLHIHPHWLRTQFAATGGWVIDVERTSLCDFGFSDAEDSAPAILRRGVDYVEQLLQPVRGDYRCCAFRAGGLVLQPHEGAAIAALLAAGLSIDSSVAPGLVTHSELGDIDYALAPRGSHWRVSPETGLTRAAASGLVELPIATFSMGWRRRIGFMVRRVRWLGHWRGTSITRNTRQSRWRSAVGVVGRNLRYLRTDPVFLLSCDTKGFDIAILMAGLQQWVEARSAESVVAAVMISHPKLMFAEQIGLLEAFVDRVRRQYPGVAFAPFAEAHKVLGTT